MLILLKKTLFRTTTSKHSIARLGEEPNFMTIETMNLKNFIVCKNNLENQYLHLKSKFRYHCLIYFH